MLLLLVSVCAGVAAVVGLVLLFRLDSDLTTGFYEKFGTSPQQYFAGKVDFFSNIRVIVDRYPYVFVASLFLDVGK
jgi:hypothetical protein